MRDGEFDRLNVFEIDTESLEASTIQASAIDSHVIAGQTVSANTVVIGGHQITSSTSSIHMDKLHVDRLNLLAFPEVKEEDNEQVVHTGVSHSNAAIEEFTNLPTALIANISSFQHVLSKVLKETVMRSSLLAGCQVGIRAQDLVGITLPSLLSSLVDLRVIVAAKKINVEELHLDPVLNQAKGLLKKILAVGDGLQGRIQGQVIENPNIVIPG